MPLPDRRMWVVVGLLAPVAFLGGRLSSERLDGRQAPASERAVFRGASLTSPFLEPEAAENSAPGMVRARTSIVRYVETRKAGDPTLRVSVYARDLNGGSWIGIDDRELYTPSSLTKVVVLIRTLQREEDEPGTLDHEIAFPGAEAMLGDDTMEGAPGESYPVRELLRRMVVYSDNFSYQLLLESGGSEGIPKMLYDLSAEQSVRDGRFYFDAHTVPVLLRSLYNSSFLSRRHSEMALRLLTESRFRDGIRKDLPPDALVAAKYGFHTSVMDGKPHYELHDCGIVYRPGSPYALCVMTATDRQSPEDLQDIVGEVSRLMWVE
jgi:beta-lactamase class A